MCFKSKRKQPKKEKPIENVKKDDNSTSLNDVQKIDKDSDTKITNNKLYYDNGYVYEGEYLNSRKHGFGIYYKRRGNGDMYIGDYSNNLYHGKGYYKWTNGSKIFGDWQMGVLNGIGVVVKNNGDIYSGEFLNDKPNGNGIYIYSNKNRYEGEFLNGIKHGKGVIYVNNGKYVCQFDNDQINGACKYYVKKDDGKYFYDQICHVNLDDNGNVVLN